MPNIITVDDFGYSTRVNVLVETAIRHGVLSHAAIMTNMSGSAPALQYAKELGNQVQYGLHLNLTEGKPLSDPDHVRSIIDHREQFLGWSMLIQRLMLGRVNHAHIEQELRAQCEAMVRAAVPISFFNSHHHIHLWPALARRISPLLKDYHITHVRAPSVVWWPALGTARGVKAITIQAFGRASARYYPPLRLRLVDLDWAGRSSEARMRLYRAIPPDCEIVCHPHDETTRIDQMSVDRSTLSWLVDRGLKN